MKRIKDKIVMSDAYHFVLAYLNVVDYLFNITSLTRNDHEKIKLEI